jgi:hypothetical protein
MIVRMFSASQSTGLSVRRLIMVGAANIEARGHASSRRRISAASKLPDSGMTLTPNRATCGSM